MIIQKKRDIKRINLIQGMSLTNDVFYDPVKDFKGQSVKERVCRCVYVYICVYEINYLQ